MELSQKQVTSNGHNERITFPSTAVQVDYWLAKIHSRFHTTETKLCLKKIYLPCLPTRSARLPICHGHDNMPCSQRLSSKNI